jgi:hypothetical protein
MERLSSHIKRIKQRGWDPMEQRFKYKLVTKLSQDYQFKLQEITPTTAHEELPDLENAFYQALSNNLQTRIIDHIHPAPPTEYHPIQQICKPLPTGRNRAENHHKHSRMSSGTTYPKRIPARTPTPRGPRTFTTMPHPNEGQLHQHEGQFTPPHPTEPHNTYALHPYA